MKQTRTKPISQLSFTPTSTGLLQRKCACGDTPGVDGECAECRKKRLSLQRHASSHVSPLPAVPPIVHDVMRSPGQPLDTGTRAFMEPRFGHDFSDVRIHSNTPLMPKTDLTISQPGDQGEQEADRMAEQVMQGPKHGVGYDFSQVRIHNGSQAAESARALNALAYTVGRDVVFGAGQYAPGTSVGKRLLAHELTHVVQQTGQYCTQVQRQEEKATSQPEWKKQLDEILPQHVGPLVWIDRYLTLLEVFGEATLSELVNRIYNNNEARKLVHEYGVPGMVALSDTLSGKGLDAAKARKALEDQPERYSRTALELRSRKSVSDKASKKEIQEKKTPYERPDPSRFNFCFIMGTKGVYKVADWFAKTYYSGAHKIIKATSLCGILEEIQNNVVNKLADDPHNKIGQVVVISHADKKGRFYFPINDTDRNKYITPDEIVKILSPDWLGKTGLNCRFAARDVSRASDVQTHVIVKGCNIGQNQAAIDALRELFGGQAHVTAPTKKVEMRTHGRYDKGRTHAQVISWMVKNGYLAPEAEEWPSDKKEEFVESLFPANWKKTGVSGIPADYLLIGNELVPPSDPRYRENLAESKPPKGDELP